MRVTTTEFTHCVHEELDWNHHGIALVVGNIGLGQNSADKSKQNNLADSTDSAEDKHTHDASSESHGGPGKKGDCGDQKH